MNDFFDNFSGPPTNCTGGPDLEALAEEAANQATCKRCGVLVLKDSSATGLVLGRLIVPAVGINASYQLCGKCGLALQEFLSPSILTEQDYLNVKSQLFQEYWT